MSELLQILRIYGGVARLADAWQGRKCRRPQQGGGGGVVVVPGPTQRITGLRIDFNRLVKAADGTDNWPMIPADDGYTYAVGGDGWGFEHQGPKRSMIISRLSSSLRPPQAVIRAKDVWHGDGKAYGGISDRGRLYIYQGAGSGWDAMEHTNVVEFSLTPFQQLRKVRLFGWGPHRGIFHPVAVQGMPGDYVYLFSAAGKKQQFEIVDDPAAQWLIRCRRDQLMNPQAYEYFAGRPGVERWTRNIDAMRPVAHVHKTFLPAAQYLPWINRFIMIDWNEIHTPSGGFKEPRCSLRVYEAPAVYGPWNRVCDLPYFGHGHLYPSVFYANFAPGWWDWPRGWLVFTGFGHSDNFYTVPVQVQTE